MKVAKVAYSPSGLVGKPYLPGLSKTSSSLMSDPLRETSSRNEPRLPVWHLRNGHSYPSPFATKCLGCSAKESMVFAI